MSTSRFPLPALLAACCVLLTACDQTTPEAPAPASQEFALPGADGDFTLTDGVVVVNQYAVLAANASAGDSSIQVTDITHLLSPAYGPLGSGDLVFIMQMQGASIDTSNSAAYGTITSLNGAGLHEFAVVRSVEGNTIHLACAGLQHSYATAVGRRWCACRSSRTSPWRAARSLESMPWNGQRGGVVVIDVNGTTTLDGTINVSGQGFRAGAREEISRAAPVHVTTYRSSDASDGAEKGESIAGDAAVYDALGRTLWPRRTGQRRWRWQQPQRGRRWRRQRQQRPALERARRDERLRDGCLRLAVRPGLHRQQQHADRLVGWRPRRLQRLPGEPERAHPGAQQRRVVRRPAL